MTNIDIIKLDETGIVSIINWYKQPDKSWLYCDDPVYSDNYDIAMGLKYVLDLSFNHPDKIDYYLIEMNHNRIGFAIVRNVLEYFKERDGVSVGINIINSDARGKGYGSTAIKKL